MAEAQERAYTVLYWNPQGLPKGDNGEKVAQEIARVVTG